MSKHKKTPKECPLCKAGSPTRIQATNWNDKVGKPVHKTDTYPYFEWCKLGGYP